jgi:hypothetical protein
MQVRVQEQQEARTKWWAVNDRRLRNYVNRTLWTDAEQARAEGMRYALELAYSNKGVHVNYNKTCISVKVDGARVRDNKALGYLEQQWQERGVTKVVTAQGITYKFGSRMQ